MFEIIEQNFDFNDDVKLGQDIYTKLYNKDLILKNVYLYNGPISMQYLPYGGIQSVFGYKLIINTKIGFITCDELIYDNVEYRTEDFVKKYNNLVNLILPN